MHYSSPTRAKASIHLRSQKPPPAHLSEQAIAVFEQEAKKAGLKSDTSGWKEELFAHGEPLLAQVTSYWRPILTSADSGIDQQTAQGLAERFLQLAQQFPAKASDRGKYRPESLLARTPQAIRSSRKLSEYPVPLVQWGDLPLAKI